MILRDGPRRRRRRRARRPGRAPPVPRRRCATASTLAGARRAERDRPRGARRALRHRRPARRLPRAARGGRRSTRSSSARRRGRTREVVLAALDAGLHVFVEKPMCITLADADAIIAARDRAGKVVQVGTMKRYDPASERMLESLPDSADDAALRQRRRQRPRVRAVLRARARSSAAPTSRRDADRGDARGEAEQVERGRRLRRPGRRPRVLARASSAACCTTSTSSTGCSSGWASRCRPRSSPATGGTRAAPSTARFGSRTAPAGDSAWIQLLDVSSTARRSTFFFADEVHTLAFPSPWLKQSPDHLPAQRAGTDARRRQSRRRLRRVVRARARALPRLHRRRDAVPHAARAGAARHRRADADVPRRTALMRAGDRRLRASSRACTRRAARLGVTVVAVCSRTRSGAEQLAEEIGTATAFDDRSRSCSTASGRRAPRLHAERAARRAGARGARARHPRRLREAARDHHGRERAHDRGARGERPGRRRRYHVRGYPLVEHMRATVAAGRARRARVRPRPLPLRRRLLVDRGLAARPGASGPSYVVGDLGTHWLDLAEHVTGARVLRGARRLPPFVPGRPLEDYAALLLRFDGGATGSRSLGSAPRPQEPAALRARGQPQAGFTWDQELPERAPRTGTRTRRRRSSSRTRRRTPSARAALALPGRPRRGLRRGVPEPVRDVYARDGRRAARPVPDVRATGTAASRRSRRAAQRPRRRLGRRRG